MIDMYEINKKAIDELQNGNEAVALKMLRENRKKSPCCLTLNNLGIYYSQWGMLCKNGTVRSAKKLGLRLLMKASEYGVDWHNCVTAATVLCEYEEFSTAYELFLKAYEINSDELIRYNIAACLFRMKKYKEARDIFRLLCTKEVIEQIDAAGGQNPLLILAYCCLKQKNKQECERYIRQYRDMWKEDERFDVFYLRYMCGLYEEAFSECEELLKEWHLTQSLLAMIVDCVERLKIDEYYDNNVIRKNNEKRWNELKENESLRMKKVQEYEYVPPLIDMYCFIM